MSKQSREARKQQQAKRHGNMEVVETTCVVENDSKTAGPRNPAVDYKTAKQVNEALAGLGFKIRDCLVETKEQYARRAPSVMNKGVEASKKLAQCVGDGAYASTSALGFVAGIVTKAVVAGYKKGVK